MNNDIHEGSRVFIHMPGDRVLTGILERSPYQIHNFVESFHVKTPHGDFTANLQRLSIPRTMNSGEVDEYRCFIPIRGNRVLSSFLMPHSSSIYFPHSTRVYFRIPEENNAIYSGVMQVGEGEGPRWLTRL